MSKAKLDEKGLVSTPAKIRPEVGLGEGEETVIDRVGSTLVLRKVSPALPPVNSRGGWRRKPIVTAEEALGGPDPTQRKATMSPMPRTASQELGRPSTPRCLDCGSAFRRMLLPFRLGRRLLGHFPADVCAKGHEYFTEEGGAAIQAAARVLKARGSARGKPSHPSSSRRRAGVDASRDS